MIDPVWEEKYIEGFNQLYPWDSVVSFVFRYAPKGIPRQDCQVLEIGFGSGSNLWFAAREGYSVSGIEGSKSAVRGARKRFQREGLAGRLEIGDFVKLPFKSDYFDLAIDRAALTHVGKSDIGQAICEVWRVLKPGGYFHFNVYAEGHSSAVSGSDGDDGLKVNISAGSLVDVGQVYFVSRNDIDEFFANSWEIHQLQRREWTDDLRSQGDVHAEWLVIACKR